MQKLRGTGPALVTPMNANGSIDYDGLEKLANYVIDGGVDYLVVCGTTGESATTTAAEKKDILAAVKDINQERKPIVYGIGGNNTRAVLDTIADTDFTGVTAILSVSPYYNKPSQAGIIAHYTAIADKCPVPVILYNVPGRTMSNVEAATTLELAKHRNIIGVKEASGDLTQCKEIADNKPEDFMLISGDDMLTPDMIKLGAIGVISVLANAFPEPFSTMTRAALNGEMETTNSLHEQFKPLDPLMYTESNPVGVKAALELKGICEGHVRLPLLKATSALQEQVKAVLI